MLRGDMAVRETGRENRAPSTPTLFQVKSWDLERAGHSLETQVCLARKPKEALPTSLPEQDKPIRKLTWLCKGTWGSVLAGEVTGRRRRSPTSLYDDDLKSTPASTAASTGQKKGLPSGAWGAWLAPGGWGWAGRDIFPCQFMPFISSYMWMHYLVKSKEKFKKERKRKIMYVLVTEFCL